MYAKPMDTAVKSDLRTLARFITFYCAHRHADELKTPVAIKNRDLDAIIGRQVDLCPTCCKLFAHAFVKRTRCPLSPKPACKRCPSHCFHPEYRRQIREVMGYSGRQLALRGRLDYLLHLLF